MATVNRYSQLTPAQYNPYSLQELMLAPAYMRQQHDALTQGSAELDAKIAEVDPLSLHSDVAAQEQKRLYDMIQQQVDTLNKEGFNPSSKTNFVKLNKAYQQAISPTGKLGKINQAKQVYNENYKNFIDQAVKMGHSPAAAERNWQQFTQQYQDEFAETGQIAPIGNLNAPRYINAVSYLSTLAKEAGTTMSDIASGNGAIVMDPTTGSYVVNTKSRDINQNNSQQLQSLADHMNSVINDPNSDLMQSAAFEGKTKEDIFNEINDLYGVYREDKKSRVREQSFNSFSPIKRDTGRPTTFVRDAIQGFKIGEIAQDTVLNQLGRPEGYEFNDNGELIEEGEYDTYQDKLDAFEKKGYEVRFDQDTGTYVAESPYSSPNKGGLEPGAFVINKDPNHMKGDLNKIRKENPQLANLSDRDLVQRLNDYRESIQANYFNSVELTGATYEWMNDRTFGSEKGSGENTSGVFNSIGATINGKQYTSDQIIDELGYNNDLEFKEVGKPTVRGYVPALGKWRASVRDAEGNPVTFFIDAIPEFKQMTTLTNQMSKLAVEGKAFAKVGETRNGEGLYFVNDFVEPKLVKSYNGIESISQIPQDHMEQGKLMSEVNGKETGNLISSPLYQDLSFGVKD